MKDLKTLKRSPRPFLKTESSIESTTSIMRVDVLSPKHNFMQKISPINKIDST